MIDLVLSGGTEAPRVETSGSVHREIEKRE